MIVIFYITVRCYHKKHQVSATGPPTRLRTLLRQQGGLGLAPRSNIHYGADHLHASLKKARKSVWSPTSVKEDVNSGPSLLSFLLLCEQLFPPSLQVGLSPRKFIQLVLEKVPPPVDFFLLDFKFRHGLLIERLICLAWNAEALLRLRKQLIY